MLSTNYKVIPASTRESLDQYNKHHLPVGGFLSAVLSNDLYGAFARADDGNLAALGEIVCYCYWEIPSQCWGSPEKVRDWLREEGW